MFSVVAIPATDMTKSENSETCLVHWYINPTFVSRTAGFAHQKGSEDREGILWRRNMGSIGAGAALRVLLLYRNLQCSCLAQEQRKGDYQVGLLSLCDPNWNWAIRALLFYNLFLCLKPELSVFIISECCLLNLYQRCQLLHAIFSCVY